MLEKFIYSRKKLSTALLIGALIASLSMSFLVPWSVFSVQPPIVSDTYYVGREGQPLRLDPATASDNISRDVVMNVYETLVGFADKPLAPLPVPPSRSTNMSDPALWADLSLFEPILATALPTVSPDGLTWTFTINTSAVFHDWTAANGTVITGQRLTVDDVEYTFKRMLVQDMHNSSSWLFNRPATGYDFFDPLDANSSTTQLEPSYNSENTSYGEYAVAQLIDNTVSSSVNTVVFNFNTSTPITDIMQTFAHTVCSVVNKAFCIEHGCWNGTFYDGWSTDYRRKPTTKDSPLDIHYPAKSKYPMSSSVPAMCGTGPYRFTSWDKANMIWRMDWFINYWRGWLNAGDKAGNFMKTIIERGIDDWPTREFMFLSGDFDECYVSRDEMNDLLETEYQPIPYIYLYYDIPLPQPYDRRWTRDWVRGWYFNALYPGFYYYDIYKVTSALQNVDLDITGTITPIVSYPVTYWYKAQMRIGNGDPIQIDQTPNLHLAIFKYSIHLRRIDPNGNVPILMAVVGLRRENASFGYEYTNVTIVLLPPGGEATVSMDWSEDGSDPASFPPNKTWKIGAETYPVNSNAPDVNLANNLVYDGSTQCNGPLVGDINGDGIVDIFDAILLASAFGSSTGQMRWNADADLKPDGTIDIFDAIILASNFNKHIP